MISPGLYDVLGEIDATQSDLMKAGETFIAALYGQSPGTTMGEARYLLYTRKRGKPLKLMALPPASQNLMFHILRTHHAVILGKAANQQCPPELDICQFGWEIKDGIPIPAISKGPAGPKTLLEVIACNCASAEKACSAHSCSCHHEGLSCTVYCKCSSGEKCRNPHKADQEEEDDNETQEQQEDNEAEDELEPDMGLDEWE